MTTPDFRFPSHYEIDRVQHRAEMLRARAFRDGLHRGVSALAALPRRIATAVATRKPA